MPRKPLIISILPTIYNYSDNDRECATINIKINFPSISTDEVILRPRKRKEFKITCDNSCEYDFNLFSDDDTDKDPTFHLNTRVHYYH